MNYGKIYNGYFLLSFMAETTPIIAPTSSQVATSASIATRAPSVPVKPAVPVAPVIPMTVPQNPTQPNPAIPVGQPGIQPGMPLPEQKKSKWWLWLILGLGVVILVGLVAYFVFR